MEIKPRGVERRPKNATIGVLLIHGFWGNPMDMASLGEILYKNEIASFAMILAGHETSPEDLARTTIEDWYQSAALALEHVRSWNLEHIFVAGLSVGGLITLDLAHRQPELEGIILLSPAIKVGGLLGKLLPIIRRIMPYRSVDTSYLTELYDLPRTRYEREPLIATQRVLTYAKYMQKKLPEIKTPTLIIQSGNDSTVDPRGATMIYKRIGAEDKELHVIEGAEHVITCHPKRAEAFPFILDWIHRHS